jgi:hypothetical protein
MICSSFSPVCFLFYFLLITHEPPAPAGFGPRQSQSRGIIAAAKFVSPIESGFEANFLGETRGSSEHETVHRMAELANIAHL